MRAFSASLLVAAAVAYYQPGDPPQCFDEYQCIFHRFPTETGLKSEYSWDLRKLCAGGGSEYVASRDKSCVLDANNVCPDRCNNDWKGCNSDKTQQIRFNICGTVSGPVASVKEEDCPANAATPGCPSGVGSNQEIPLPASHGVAVQYIEGYPGPAPPAGYGPPPLPGQKYGCADIDTCDQRYNPNCVPGTANYDIANAPPATDPFYPTYTARSSRCASQGLGYCSPYNYWCCSVKATPCTKQAEVVAIYDGSPPAFNLLNEGNPNGISLTYVGAPAYRDDSFPCGDVDNPNDPGVDPSTQYPQQRSFTVQLNCDKNAKTGISGLYFYEPSPCQYIAVGGSALACGAVGDPFNKPYTGADAFGFVVLGATLYGFCYIVYCYGEYKLWWEPIKARMPDVSGYLPVWLGGRGGVFAGGSNAYKFVGAAGGAGAAAPSATPISASAYGST